MPKRTRITIVLLSLLVVLGAAAVILQKQSRSQASFFSEFAVSDTSNITSIILTDRDNRTITLERISPGEWKLNKAYTANSVVIESLLKTLYNIEVKGLVAKSAHNAAVSNMAARNTYVRIYQKVPRIRLGKMNLFPHIKMTKSYYVGGPTQDHLGTYMKLPDNDRIYITYVPGQNAFLSLRYSTSESDWRDHTIIALTIQHIKSVEAEIPGRPDESYRIEKTGERTFNMYQYYDKPVTIPLDSIRVLEFLAAFRNIKYEGLINDITQERRDSILNSVPMQTLTITGTDNRKHTIVTFRRKSPYAFDEVTGKVLQWDRDRLYALINDGKDLTLCQFYVFDEILKPFTWFRADFNPAEQGSFSEEQL
ncbi:MAG TPA: DUF4340 domain-containing protein [Bacteroidales bacterium]|nr:DUF4340 domain-containing protein [Bacteroidales bacterium]HRZ50107.1 DUF4340 domain-containing protein [Bacteroidales bacterium]